MSLSNRVAHACLSPVPVVKLLAQVRLMSIAAQGGKELNLGQSWVPRAGLQVDLRAINFVTVCVWLTKCNK